MDFRGEKTLPKKDEYEDEGTWIWLSMACESRLLLAHCVGPRTQKTANQIVAKTARRLASIPLFVTDGLKFYKNALLNQYFEIIKYPPTGKRGRCQRRDKTVQLWRNKTVQFYLRLLPSHISTHLILKSSEELSPASCDP